MADALDILLGHTEVQMRAAVVDGEVCRVSRIVAVDRFGAVTVYADWAQPVQLEKARGES